MADKREIVGNSWLFPTLLSFLFSFRSSISESELVWPQPLQEHLVTQPTTQVALPSFLSLFSLFNDLWYRSVSARELHVLVVDCQLVRGARGEQREDLKATPATSLANDPASHSSSSDWQTSLSH
jgi:hypothetical protein